MSKLNVDQKTIKDLFQSKKSDFLIPDYQRPYAWGEAECRTLWDDIFSFAIPDEGKTEFDSNSEYFLGPIVTFRNEDKLEVIDGQQRLTTLMLLLRALTKENNQRPMKLNKVQVNSLAILTTRVPYAPEKDRFVFGVFLVDEAYEGDNREEGYVTTSSKYKLSLSLEEAKKILFWNYYHNENAPEKAAWGQGLHRYITDVQAACILRDIAQIKANTSEQKLAIEFLDYFCNINGLDKDELPELDGALQR